MRNYQLIFLTIMGKKLVSCRGYKPPEYINKGETTSKFDIFSLGVIIIEVIARFIGYSRRSDMPFQELFYFVRETNSYTLTSHQFSQILLFYISSSHAGTSKLEEKVGGNDVV